jgi:hypothetical protein
MIPVWSLRCTLIPHTTYSSTPSPKISCCPSYLPFFAGNMSSLSLSLEDVLLRLAAEALRSRR